MQVRTGPRSEAEVAADAAPEAEVSRWITAQSTSHDCLVRTTVGAFVRAQAPRPRRISLRLRKNFNSASRPVRVSEAGIERQERRIECLS